MMDIGGLDMAVSVVADLVSKSVDYVVYRMRLDGRDAPDAVQDVRIPLDGQGARLRGAEIVTTAGGELSWWSREMVGKLLVDAGKKGTWPSRTGLQA